jgi:hypothetical protein
MKLAAAAAALCLGLPCAAQQPAAPASAPAATRGVPEPKVQRIVVEDDRVRIDELRVRGQTRRIVVQPKLPGAPAYQLGVNTDARDPQMDPRSEGRALWQIFSW